MQGCLLAHLAALDCSRADQVLPVRRCPLPAVAANVPALVPADCEDDECAPSCTSMLSMSLGNHHTLTHQDNDLSRAGASMCIYCSPGTYSNAAETQNLVLTQVGDFNIGGCAGVYVRDPLNRILNGFPVWINPGGNRFIGWNSYSTACYALDQLGGIVAKQGFFSPYNENKNSPDVTCCWSHYAVTFTQPGQTWSKYTLTLAGQCFEATCVLGSHHHLPSVHIWDVLVEFRSLHHYPSLQSGCSLHVSLRKTDLSFKQQA